MKRLVLLSVLATLALPSLAQADVVLEPGTKLQVVCEQKKPFRGDPFSHGTSVENPSVDHYRVHGRLVRRYLLTHDADPDLNENDGGSTTVFDAVVTVRRVSAQRFVLRTTGLVGWRGC